METNGVGDCGRLRETVVDSTPIFAHFQLTFFPSRNQVSDLRHPDNIYSECMELIISLAALGFIHCDFNEFNLLVTSDDKIYVIDFPQMVSTSHLNAKM